LQFPDTDDNASHSNGDESLDRAACVTGFLAFAAMAFHSLGDFNLQMPATTWLLAGLTALALAAHPPAPPDMP
jgi:hypothetical protein